MEEKKEIKEKINNKLSYEQLEAYAAQTTEQAKKVFQENQILKKALYENSLKEVDLAIKCLDHTDKFSKDFIKVIIKRIEEVMTPLQEEQEEENKKEN